MTVEDKAKIRKEPTLSTLHEAVGLARHLRDMAWAAPVMLVLGISAAVAETLGVGLAAVFLFTILDQTTAMSEGGGLVALAYQRFGPVFSAGTTAIASLFFAFILAKALLLYAYQVTTASVMNRIAERMRDKIHKVYVTVGYRYLQERERGALIHTLATETWMVSDAAYAFARIGVNFCAAVVFTVGLAALSWQIALTAAVCSGIIFTLQRLLTRPLRRYGEQTLAENQILAERMLVSLQGMRTLRAFAQETYMLRLFSNASAKVRRIASKAEQIKALLGPISEIGSLGTIILIALVAGWSNIEVPTTIASVMLLFRLQPHLREFEAHRLSLAGMGAALRNVRQMLERNDKPWPTQGSTEFTGLKGEIRFDDVTFVHDPRRPPSLDRASFAIRRGEVTVLSGPSGSGKTTIINLLLRLYEPDGGKIMIDDVDLLTIKRESWIGRLAVAGQDVELIEGTVEQNIRIARHDATEQELRDACATAEILDDIMAIPEGFAARIGPGGLSFSGGQRQRLGLARALVRKPEFLILDEALSALEPALEDRIRVRLAESMTGCTILVISHRADAIAQADTVVRIVKGQVELPSLPRLGS